MNKKLWTALGVTIVVVAIAGTVAMAATPADSCKPQMDAQHQVMMDQMVTDGIVSAEQAKAMKDKMSDIMANPGNSMSGMMQNKMGNVSGATCHEQRQQ